MAVGSSASGFAGESGPNVAIASAPAPGSATAAVTVGADAEPEATKIPLYPIYDWLRFVLASIVVLDHHGFRVGPISGGLAVDVFFALSGWLIGGILLHTRASELPRFYFNRATRIWIPYALAAALLYGFALVREGYSFYWLKYLVLDSTFTHNIYTIFPAAASEMPLGGSGNQFWSISVEEQFYLFAPLLLSLAIVPTPIGRSPWLWGAISAALLATGALGAPIALGVTAAIVRDRRGWSFGEPAWWMLAGVTAALLALVAYAPSSPARAFFALAVVLLTSVEGARSAVAVVLGGLSFPLYLNHWIGIFAVHFVEKRYLALPEEAVIAASYLLNVAIAAGLYWAVDRQIQRYRSRWYSPRIGQSLAAVAYFLLAVGLVTGSVMNRVPPHGPSAGAAALPMEEKGAR